MQNLLILPHNKTKKMKKRKTLKKIVHFSKWTQKNYSVFNSLKKTIKICYLSLSCSLVAIPATTKAQQSDTTSTNVVDMKEILITSERTPTLLSQTAKSVKVFNKDDLIKQPFISLEQPLRSISAVDVRQRGGLGVQSDISIRGGNYEQTLILLNGINFNDPQTGHFNLNLPIDYASLNKIEILQGASARLFGVNAMSGVVNFITSADTIKQLNINAISGDFGYYSFGVNSNYYHNNFSHYISINRNSSMGYKKNTDFVSNNAYYFGSYKPKFGKFEYQIGYNTRQFGANSFYTPKYPEQFEANKTLISSIKFENNGKLKIIPSIYYRLNSDRFELFRNFNNSPSWYKNHNFHKTAVFGSNLTSYYNWLYGKTTIGFDFRNENIVSTNLGEELSEPIKINDSINYNFGHNRQIFNTFIDHRIDYKSFVITFGGMANYINDLEKWDFFPGCDISYLINTNYRIYASANSSMRMPTFTDLYYKSATLIGNINLKPEKANNYEIGGKILYPQFQGQIAFYIRQGIDLIDWIKYPIDTLWRSENLTNIIFFGFDASVSIYPHKIFENLKFIKNFKTSYSFLQTDRVDQGFQSNYALDQLKHKITIGIDIEILKHFGITTNLSFYDRYGSYLEYNNQIAGETKQYKPYWLADCRFYFENKKIIVFAEATNIFNKKYFDISSIIQPGRWFRIGTNLKIFSKIS